MGVAVDNAVGTDNGFAVFLELQGTQAPRFLADAVHAFSAGGRTYLITANEGDAREYDPAGPVVGYVEALRVGSGTIRWTRRCSRTPLF